MSADRNYRDPVDTALKQVRKLAQVALEHQERQLPDYEEIVDIRKQISALATKIHSYNIQLQQCQASASSVSSPTTQVEMPVLKEPKQKQADRLSSEIHLLQMQHVALLGVLARRLSVLAPFEQACARSESRPASILLSSQLALVAALERSPQVKTAQARLVVAEKHLGQIDAFLKSETSLVSSLRSDLQSCAPNDRAAIRQAIRVATGSRKQWTQVLRRQVADVEKARQSLGAVKRRVAALHIRVVMAAANLVQVANAQQDWELRCQLHWEREDHHRKAM